MDDLLIAAHHAAHLRGDVIANVVGWARAWAPWLPEDKARQLAERVAAEPRKFTADALAWRLRLSMAERTALKVTTIGAFDVSKAQRAEERKRKDREAKRAAARSGRPRGRPKKNASTAVIVSIAADAFSGRKKSKTVECVRAPARSGNQANDSLGSVSDNPTRQSVIGFATDQA